MNEGLFTSASPCITLSFLSLLDMLNLAILAREIGPRNPTYLPHLGSCKATMSHVFDFPEEQARTSSQ